MTPFERFETKYEPVTESGCWLWTAGLTGKGYGHFEIKGEKVRAHRFSYERFIGQIPNGMFVCHHCDVPSCVNPHHLFLGSNSDNMKDAVTKGRLHLQKNPLQHPNTRKTECKRGHPFDDANTQIRPN